MKDVTDKKNFDLIEMRAENFKRIKAIRMRPVTGVNMVAGRNGQGKTSALEAFAVAVGGNELAPKTPIRKGQEKAEIFVDLGGMRITRRWWFREESRELASDVRVEYADGTRPKKVQATLDDLIGSGLILDPLEFSRMKPKEQFDALRALAPDVDFADIAKQRKELFEERTQAGREADRAKAAADVISVPQGTPLKLVDVSELVAELTDANNYITAEKSKAWKREEQIKVVERMRNEADQLFMQAKAIEKNADDIQKEIDASDAGQAVLPDVEGIQAKIASAESINANVRQLIAQDGHRAEAKRQLEVVEDLTAKIEALDKKKRDAVAAAKLPVENMSFGDDEILMNDVSFTDASQAEKVRASMAIAMAMRPQIRVVLIRDGSLLDEDSLQIVQRMAVENNFVVLMETVGDGDGTGIVIEDGEVVA